MPQITVKYITRNWAFHYRLLFGIANNYFSIMQILIAYSILRVESLNEIVSELWLTWSEQIATVIPYGTGSLLGQCWPLLASLGSTASLFHMLSGKRVELLYIYRYYIMMEVSKCCFVSCLNIWHDVCDGIWHNGRADRDVRLRYVKQLTYTVNISNIKQLI